jgi:hypothetical protein
MWYCWFTLQVLYLVFTRHITIFRHGGKHTNLGGHIISHSKVKLFRGTLFLEKLIVPALVNKFHELCSLPSSQQPVTSPFQKPEHSSPHSSNRPFNPYPANVENELLKMPANGRWDLTWHLKG